SPRSRSPSHVLTGVARHADLPSIVIEAVADAGRLAIRIDDHHVRDGNRRFLRDDAARLRATLGVADAGVLLDPVHAFDEDLVEPWVGRDDLAPRALVLTGDDHNRVALPHLHAHVLQHLRRERDDLHETLVPQLASDRSEDARTARVTTVL